MSEKYNSDNEEAKGNVKSSTLSDSMDMCIPGGGSKADLTPKMEQLVDLRKNSKIEDSIFLSHGDDSDSDDGQLDINLNSAPLSKLRRHTTAPESEKGPIVSGFMTGELDEKKLKLFKNTQILIHNGLMKGYKLSELHSFLSNRRRNGGFIGSWDESALKEEIKIFSFANERNLAVVPDKPLDELTQFLMSGGHPFF